MSSEPQTAFPSFDDWPMVAQQGLLAESLKFLAPSEPEAPSRLLHVRGDSGSGKSFFVKSLLCNFAIECPAGIALYLDIDESDFESVDLGRRLIALASSPSTPTRSDPQNVPREFCFAHYARSQTPLETVAKLAFRLGRSGLALIPVVGEALKSTLPENYPKSRVRSLAEGEKVWEFLVAIAKQTPVLIALDNIQFLAKSIQVEIDTHLALSESGFRFVIIERNASNENALWQFRCFHENRHRIDISPLSKVYSDQLVTKILGVHNEEVCAAIYRKSLGNPKQVWLQLRLIMLGSKAIASTSKTNSYEEVIGGLPDLDKFILQMVTLLMGGLRLDDLVSIIHAIAQSAPKPEIRESITDLVTIGFLIINGSAHDRVKTEHELVRSTIRRTTSEPELLGLRHNAIFALTEYLDSSAPDTEKERLSDRLIGLLSTAEVRANKRHLVRLAELVRYQATKERFHYLTSLFFESPVCEVVDLLPETCLGSFLDAFQKTSQFDRGLTAIEIIKRVRSEKSPQLVLFEAKYLVQRFQYRDAERILADLPANTEADAVRFNIILNLRRDDEARQIIEALPAPPRSLDEFQCVMLRNSAHLFDEVTSRSLLDRAKHQFARLGLRFGVATTQNNRGVLEIWAGCPNAARKELQAAQAAFQDFGSNEIYQPLNNLAALEASMGNLASAETYLQMARDTVSRDLEMDALMFHHNALCLRLLKNEIALSEATVDAKETYRKSLRTSDLRFQDVLALFASDLERAVCGESELNPSSHFQRELESRDRTGIEVFIPTVIERQAISIIFVLSPHWRY